MGDRQDPLDDLLDDEELSLEEGGVPAEVRQRLVLALDVDDLVEARRLGGLLAPYFGTVKVGLELYTASGPDAVGAFVEAGFDVFCDLKLHDIPNTVGRAARVVGSLGARWVTVHTSGGATMLKAAVDGLADGAAGADLAVPGVLGITVLTSDQVASQEQLEERCELAVDSGCEGIVCAATDLAATSRFAGRLVRAVPGLRLPGGATHDQARVASPREALDEGADLLVVGRAVTAVDDPIAACEDLVDHLLG